MHDAKGDADGIPELAVGPHQAVDPLVGKLSMTSKRHRPLVRDNENTHKSTLGRIVSVFTYLPRAESNYQQPAWLQRMPSSMASFTETARRSSAKASTVISKHRFGSRRL